MDILKRIKEKWTFTDYVLYILIVYFLGKIGGLI